MPGQKHNPWETSIQRGFIPRTEYMDTMGETFRPYNHLKFLHDDNASNQKAAGEVTIHARPIKTASAAIALAQETITASNQPSLPSDYITNSNVVIDKDSKIKESKRKNTIKPPPTHKPK